MDELNRDEFVESNFEPLKIYFDQRDWKELSVYEKQRFARIKRNYENLVEMSVNPAVPPFMVKKKRAEIATCSQTDSRKKKICPETSTINSPINATKSNRESGSEQAEGEIIEVSRSNWVPRSVIDWENLPLGESNPFIPDESDEMNIDLFLEGTLKNLGSLKLLRKPCDSDICDSERESDNEPRPRFPKRNVPKICYREEDVSSDDDYIYCDDCGEQYEGSCPKHGPLNFVKDKKAPLGSKHAWNTCPDYLSVCRSGIRGPGLGIWTEQDLSKGYVFGPYKGKTVKSRKEAKDSGYAWEIRRSGKVLHYVEGVDTSASNWMRFVNCAVCEERQNLISFQYHGQILYRVYKEVKAYTELLVWYGDEFGEELGIFRNEATLLVKGVMKKLEYDKGVTSSPSIRKSYCSEPSQELLKRMAITSTFQKTVSSSDVPGELNKDQISQKSENSKRGRRGIFTENDASEKSDVSKTDGMDCIAEENLLLSDQKKYMSFEDKHGVLRKCHACPQCHYKTSKRAHLQYHRDAIHECKRHYKCRVCDYRASYSSNLRRHVHSVHEGIRRYMCNQCDYRASQATALQTHIDAVHERKKPHKCQHCEYRASLSYLLQKHIDAVHEGKKPFKCQHCVYRATQAGDLRKHVAAVHEGKKPFKCQHCDYRASLSATLREHIDSVHEGKKPYKCQHCDYRASQARDLRKHVVAVHEGKKPHPCPHCDYRAARASSVRRHVRAVHERMKPYGCRICHYRASRHYHLRNHMKAVYGGKENLKTSKV